MVLGNIEQTNRNQLNSLIFNAGTIATMTYDNGGREVTRTFGNGLVSTNSYNLDNTLSSKIVATKADLSYNYIYDINKNVKSETSTGTVMSAYSWTTNFDNLDRVTSWNRTTGENQTWTLDKIGNWGNTTGSVDNINFNENRTHNSVHELTQINTTPLSYDLKGNLIENSHGHDYTWDIDNHLKEAYKGNGNGGGLGKGTGNGLPNGLCRYEYDAFGRRVKKHVGNIQTIFISEGQQVVAEYSKQGGQPLELEQEYVYASYIDDVVAKISNADLTYYHSDRQFNIRGLTNLSGNIVELYSYTPYGKQTILTANGTEINESAYTNCYGYTGRYLDEETGLWYFRARYFDNELGRFISRDPLGYVDGMSLYNGYFAERFVLDPSGTFFIDNSGVDLNSKNGVSFEENLLTVGYSCHDCSANVNEMRMEINPVEVSESDSERTFESLEKDHSDKIDQINKKYPFYQNKCVKMILKDFGVEIKYIINSSNFTNQGETYERENGVPVIGLLSEYEVQRIYILKAKLWYNANISVAKNVFEVGCEFVNYKACYQYGEKMSAIFREHLDQYLEIDIPVYSEAGPKLKLY